MTAWSNVLDEILFHFQTFTNPKFDSITDVLYKYLNVDIFIRSEFAAYKDERLFLTQILNNIVLPKYNV